MYETKAERDALFLKTNKYTEVELLNKQATGFGWAVLVRDYRELNRLKVIKLPKSEEATKELEDEGHILVRIQDLSHPNLIRLYSKECLLVKWNDREEERSFIVLEYGGDNLRSRLGKLGMRRVNGEDEYVYQNGKAMDVEEVFRLGLQLADGLRALHEFEVSKGEHIVHRDIKPENILIDNKGQARITDFGISRVVERLTQAITAGGTPPYIAPEFTRGRISATSDVYSLGVVLYEMATGRFPFQRVQDKAWELPTPPAKVNPLVPAGLSDVIMRALDWDPRADRGAETRNRYKHGGELLADLTRCHRRLHPVPPEYERILSAPPGRHLYREKATQKEVRVFVYETRQPAICLNRLATLSHLQIPSVLSPLRVFDSEGVVGVVVPPESVDAPIPTAGLTTVDYPPAAPAAILGPAPRVSAALRMLPPRLKGAAAADFLQRAAHLCTQLHRLHQSGICHGTLTPFDLNWGGPDWTIDHVWIGALAGAAERRAVFAPDDPAVEFLAPEMRSWTAPPSVASDVYGVGSIVYAALAGQAPGQAVPGSERGDDWTVRGEPGSAIAWPRDIPRRWIDIVSCALAVDPLKRHHAVDEFGAALQGCRWPDDCVASTIDNARDDFRQGRSAEAYDGLDAAQLMDPGSPAVHHARAEFFFSDGGFDYALEENTAAYNIDPIPPVCFLQGECLLALDRSREAEPVLREGLAQRDCARGRRLLGLCLAQLGQKDRAAAEYEVALRIAERNRDADEIDRIRAGLAAIQPATS